MTLANLANIFTFYFTGPFMRGGLSTLSSATSVTMTSRITFRLHANAHKETVESYELGTLRFAAAAGTAARCLELVPLLSFSFDELGPGDERKCLRHYLHLSGLGEYDRVLFDMSTHDGFSVFLYYDHILTFPMEVKFLWSHLGFNGKSLFLLNRYYSVLGSVVVTYSMFSNALTPKVFQLVVIWRGSWLTTYLAEGVIVSLILSLRIWAIYNFNQKLLAFLNIFLVILLGLSCFSVFFNYHSSIRAVTSGEGCHSRLEFITSIRKFNLCQYLRKEDISILNLEAAGAWEALFLYDTLLLTLLLYKGFKTRRELGRLPLLEIILRDGALCYIAMTLVIVANIFTFYYISHNDISYYLSTSRQRPRRNENELSTRYVAVRWDN
ncbi:hypothetical protein K435DRAFT_798873 [Dendrothele bispora CBS 962.96]|uniref:DUF6533 domain-containing protein n=1 Tax=Dendrothele bispora (strain CBS 962.96) TaxID=1314807 RepID=A0A4V4HFD4_DENBC|nr:hypothetical protein K435DRAFT_798873 [Dendrothele bispora CBS 962.96]